MGQLKPAYQGVRSQDRGDQNIHDPQGLILQFIEHFPSTETSDNIIEGGEYPAFYCLFVSGKEERMIWNDGKIVRHNADVTADLQNYSAGC